MDLMIRGTLEVDLYTYTIPFAKGICIHAKTLHAGGLCRDKNNGSLRMQLHVSLDRRNNPLPVDIIQDKCGLLNLPDGEEYAIHEVNLAIESSSDEVSS